MRRVLPFVYLIIAADASAALVFSGIVAWRTPDAREPGGLVAFRPEYVWRGVPADTLVVAIGDSAAFGRMTPGASFLVRARCAPAVVCAVEPDGWQPAAAAYLAFHELGRPAWVRPGRPWLDVTADDLLTIAREQEDGPAAAAALAELRVRLAPPDFAARLEAVWQAGSAALRRAVRDCAAAAPLPPATRQRLHAAALDACADPRPEHRALAVGLLGQLRVRSEVTTAVLTRLRDADPDPDVRRAAAGTLADLAALDE